MKKLIFAVIMLAITATCFAEPATIIINAYSKTEADALLAAKQPSLTENNDVSVRNIKANSIDANAITINGSPVALASDVIAPRWITYNGQESNIKYPLFMTADGNLICKGDEYTGIRSWDGRRFSYGPKAINTLCYATPIGDKGIMIQTLDGTTPHLEYAADTNSSVSTFTDVTPVGWTIDSSILAKSLIDCGVHDGNHIIMFFEYGGTASARNAWYTINYGTTWTKLWTNNATAVVHFHGGLYEPRAGTDGRLYVFTGDSNPKSSLLFCDDVCDLIVNPETWYTRWGLGIDRTTWSPDMNYVADWNDQRARIVGMVSDGNNGYWQCDQAVSSTLGIFKINHATREVTTLGVWPQVKGSGWYGLCTSNNDILFVSGSVSAAGAFPLYNDEWVRLYQIKNDIPYEVSKWRVSGYNPFANPPVGPVTSSAVYVNYLAEGPRGVVHLYEQGLHPFNYGMLSATTANGFCGRGMSGTVGDYNSLMDFDIGELVNPVMNGQFRTYTDSGFSYSDGNFPSWTRTGFTDANMYQDGNVVEGYNRFSCCLDINSGSPYLYQTIQETNLPRDSYVTVKAKIRVDAGAAVGFQPSLILTCNPVSGTATSATSKFYLNTAASTTGMADSTWHEIWTSLYLHNNVNSVQIKLNHTGGKGKVYWSDIRIENGICADYKHF